MTPKLLKVGDVVRSLYKHGLDKVKIGTIIKASLIESLSSNYNLYWVVYPNQNQELINTIGWNIELVYSKDDNE
jgi:hypothetical protein